MNLKVWTKKRNVNRMVSLVNQHAEGYQIKKPRGIWMASQGLSPEGFPEEVSSIMKDDQM